MKILGLEFSTELRSAAVAEANGGAVQLLGAAFETQPRSRGPIELLEDALIQAGLERESIDRIAVGLGPGSYTGIRAAIAFAQGWCLARETPAVGISTAAVLAAQAAEAGITGRVNVIIDAQRGDIYFAGWELKPTGPREIEALRLVREVEVETLRQSPGTWIGPEVQRWFSGGREFIPSAAVLVALAARIEPQAPAEPLEPIYLREVNFVKAPPPRAIASI